MQMQNAEIAKAFHIQRHPLPVLAEGYLGGGDKADAHWACSSQVD